MKKSIKKNFVYNIFFQILTLIVPLITTPYVSRVLGAQNVGIYSYSTAMVTYFVIIFTLGSTTFGQRSIAIYSDDKKMMTEVFWNVFSFRILSSLIGIVIYFIFLLITNACSNINIVVSLNIINIAIDINWFFQGIEEFKKTIIRNCIVKIICLISMFIFVKTSNDTVIYILIFCGSVILGNLTLWISLPKYVSKPKRIRPFFYINDMFLLFIPTISSQVYTVLDKSMLGWIIGTGYEIGCYEQSERIARAALVVVTAVGSVILPRVANLYNNGNVDLAKDYVYKGYKVVWSIGLPITFGIIAISPNLIPIYLGKGFELSIVLLQIFSLLVIFVSLAYITGISYLIPSKQQNIYSISVMIAAIFNFFTNLILIPKYGTIGAAITSVSAECIGVIIQIGYCLLKKQLNFKRIYSSMWKYFFSALVMCISIKLLGNILLKDISNLLLEILFGIVLYFGCLVVLKDDFVLPNIKMVLYKIISNLKKAKISNTKRAD